jgi:hypothetical protein
LHRDHHHHADRDRTWQSGCAWAPWLAVVNKNQIIILLSVAVAISSAIAVTSIYDLIDCQEEHHRAAAAAEKEKQDAAAEVSKLIDPVYRDAGRSIVTIVNSDGVECEPQYQNTAAIVITCYASAKKKKQIVISGLHSEGTNKAAGGDPTYRAAPMPLNRSKP